jgi:hypothetical protein
VRPVGRAIKAFLYIAIAAAFWAGAQLTLLAEETDRYWAWAIAVPSTAVFLGASYWSTAALFYWGVRQRDWIRVRAVVSGGVFVTTGLLVATLRHLEAFHDRPIGVLWVEVYVLAVPAFFAAGALQLATPGYDPPVERPLPPFLRWPLAAQAAIMLGFGVALFARSGDTSYWPWDLTPLSAEAIAAWLLGIGASAAYIAWRADDADMPGPAVAYVILGALWLIGAARFSDDLDGLGGALYIAFAASILAVGAAGCRLAWRQGGFDAVRGFGGVPVELRAPGGGLASAGAEPMTTREPRDASRPAGTG